MILSKYKLFKETKITLLQLSI